MHAIDPIINQIALTNFEWKWKHHFIFVELVDGNDFHHTFRLKWIAMKRVRVDIQLLILSLTTSLRQKPSLWVVSSVIVNFYVYCIYNVIVIHILFISLNHPFILSEFNAEKRKSTTTTQYIIFFLSHIEYVNTIFIHKWAKALSWIRLFSIFVRFVCLSILLICFHLFFITYCVVGGVGFVCAVCCVNETWLFFFIFLIFL